MFPRHALCAAALATVVLAPTAHATDIALAADGAWHAFAVDSFLAPPAASLGWIDDNGALLSFTFVIGSGALATLTVVDAAFAGDTFSITNFGVAFGATSSVPVGTYPTSHDVGTDFDAALRDPSFSRAVFSLDPGAYRISGDLKQSVLFDGVALDSTVGAVRLAIAAPVPEPESYALMLAGLGAIGMIARRRSRNRR